MNQSLEEMEEQIDRPIEIGLSKVLTKTLREK
jgi:hypothetical protein